MAEIKLEDLLKKQEDMAKRMIALSEEKEVGKLMAAAPQFQAEAAELEKLCEAFAAQEEAKAGPRKRLGITTVVLTSDQQRRIFQETGVEMTEIDVEDDSGVFTRSMPDTRRLEIERIALTEARGRKEKQLAEEKARVQANELLERAIGLNVPGLSEQIERAKQDPSFLGGLFHKKK